MINDEHIPRSILTERVWPIVRALLLHALTWSGLLRFIAVAFLFNITTHWLHWPQIDPSGDRWSVNPDGQMWALVIGGVVHLLLFIWAWKRLEHKPFSAMLLAFSRRLWRPLFFGLIVGLGEILLVFGILAVLGSVHIEWGDVSISSQVLLAAAGWFVVSSLLAPILEEIECRGYLFQNVKRGWGTILAIIVTAAVFAARHIQNPNANTLGLVNIALISIVFTVGMLRFRSLWFPIGWHASWNFAQFFLFGLPNSGYSPDGLGLPGTTLLVSQISGPIWLTGGKFGLEGSAISTIVLLGILLWLWKGFKTGNGGLEDLPPSDRGEESDRDPVGEPSGHPIQKTNVAPVQEDVDVPFC